VRSHNHICYSFCFNLYRFVRYLHCSYFYISDFFKAKNIFNILGPVDYMNLKFVKINSCKLKCVRGVFILWLLYFPVHPITKFLFYRHNFAYVLFTFSLNLLNSFSNFLTIVLNIDKLVQIYRTEIPNSKCMQAK
jgi:hypothetical protein